MLHMTALVAYNVVTYSMKRKLLFLLVLFGLFVLAVCGRYLYLKTQIKEGRLKIISSPTATVFLDEKQKGRTPFERGLREGEYLLKLVSETTASSSAQWSGKVLINHNTLSVVDWQLGADDLSTSGVSLSVSKMKTKATGDTGEIKVDTDPSGSIVYLDNEEHGIAPLILSDVSAGDHELSVFNPGFFRRTQKIQVEHSYRVNAEFKLAMDPTYRKVDITPDEESPATESATIEKNYIKINETQTGWLRVRDKPSTGGLEVAKVDPGSTYKILTEENGWYQIEYEKGKKGWVSGEYVTKTESASTTTPVPQTADEST